MNQDDFLKKFNRMFDQLDNVDDQQTFGYNEWLKNNTCEKKYNIHNVSEMHNVFEQEKEIIQQHTKSTDQNIVTIEENQHTLSRRSLDTYDSTVFAKLQYQDLKKALSETIIPVAKQPDKQISIHEYKKKRDSETQYYTDNSDMHQNKQKQDTKNETIRQLYELAKQHERQNQNQIIWKSCIQQLKNDI